MAMSSTAIKQAAAGIPLERTAVVLERRSDGSAYRKLPARPDADTMAMLRALRARP